MCLPCPFIAFVFVSEEEDEEVSSARRGLPDVPLFEGGKVNEDVHLMPGNDREKEIDSQESSRSLFSVSLSVTT